jgi:membrane protein implicated in regulation of membrane protease activity
VSVWSGLALLLIAAKLAGAIGWPWWLVLLPLYGQWIVAAAAVWLLVLFAQVSMRDSSSPQEEQR